MLQFFSTGRLRSVQHECRRLRGQYATPNGTLEYFTIMLGFRVEGEMNGGVSYWPHNSTMNHRPALERGALALWQVHGNVWRSFAREFKAIAGQCNSLEELVTVLLQRATEAHASQVQAFG